MKSNKFIVINSISELHLLGKLGKPLHSMVSLIMFSEVVGPKNLETVKTVFNLYSLFLKKDVKGKIKYGQEYYYFDEGVLGMNGRSWISNGSWRSIIRNRMGLSFSSWLYTRVFLVSIYKKTQFFSYAVKEALHLSTQEESLFESIFHNIDNEFHTSIDIHSQDVMIT